MLRIITTSQRGGEMEDDYSDFRLDPDLLNAIKALLRQGMNYASVSKVVSVDSRTVKRIDLRVKELMGEEVDKVKEKKEIKHVSITEHQKVVDRLNNLQEKHNAQVKLYNTLVDFLNKNLVPRVDYLQGRDKSLSNWISTNATDIDHLKSAVNVIKQLRKSEIAEFMAGVKARQNERYRAKEEADKRVVEDMVEERRQREQGSTDAFFKKLEELKNMDKKRC